MNSNKKQNNSSITIDLESLRQKYSNLLIKYERAVADYVNFLNVQSQEPCIKYNSNSKGIDQTCYEYIWKKSGCGTGNVQPSSSASWSQSQTLNGLIYDSWLWATKTDTTHRQGCYGKSTKYNTSTAPDYNINKQELVSIQGKAFTGTGSAGQSSATTLQDCMASCTNSNKCTGATFVSNKCEIRTGDSQIVSSSQKSYAIIPKEKQLLLNIEDINQQLLDVNKQLVTKIEVSETAYDKTNDETKIKNQELIKSYESLLEERRNIEKMLNEYETLDNTENENQIKINKNYYLYNLLLIISIAVIFILYKMFSSNSSPDQVVQYGGDLGINAYYIVFGLIIFIIFVNFLMKYLTI